MKILPFEKYEIRSSMRQEELCASIDKACEPWKFTVSFGGQSKPLFGKRRENEFKVCRAIGYQNSFLPVAFGKISETGTEVLVEITLKIDIVLMLFMAVWFSFAFMGALTIGFSGAGEPSLSPFGMLAFGYLLMQGEFWFKVPRLKSLISNIVQEQT